MQQVLHQDVLALLVHDDSNCKLLSAVLTSKFFESTIHRIIAEVCIRYIREHKKAPKRHLELLLEKPLEDGRTGSFLREEMESLELIYKTINAQFIMGQLTAFLKKENLYREMTSAFSCLETGDLDGAEKRLRVGLEPINLNLDDFGVLMQDFDSVKKSVETRMGKQLPLGIPVLDKVGIGCRSGELMLVMAPAKRGKSWWLIHQGKFAMMNSRSVLHVTLEMSAGLVVQRYLQSFFSLTQTEAVPMCNMVRFSRNDFDQCTAIEFESVEREALKDVLERKTSLKLLLKRIQNKAPLYVKEFATNALTIPKLEAFLDLMGEQKHFHPEVIIVDYADLMSAQQMGDYRISVGHLYKELRRIAVERDCVVVTASQTNKGSVNAALVTESSVAEDWSKIATADLVMTYSQSFAEHKMGLARLLVSNARSSVGRQVALISQAYSCGQFCLDSALVNDKYDSILKAHSPGNE